MASKKGRDLILVKWCDNNSELYDGKEHYIPKKLLLKKDAKVGEMVKIKWAGRKIWKGVLLEDAPNKNQEQQQKKKPTSRKPKSPKTKDKGSILWIGRQKISGKKSPKSLKPPKTRREIENHIECNTPKSSKSPYSSNETALSPMTPPTTMSYYRTEKAFDEDASPIDESHPIPKSTSIIKYHQKTPKRKEQLQTSNTSNDACETRCLQSTKMTKPIPKALFQSPLKVQNEESAFDEDASPIDESHPIPKSTSIIKYLQKTPKRKEQLQTSNTSNDACETPCLQSTKMTKPIPKALFQSPLKVQNGESEDSTIDVIDEFISRPWDPLPNQPTQVQVSPRMKTSFKPTASCWSENCDSLSKKNSPNRSPTIKPKAVLTSTELVKPEEDGEDKKDIRSCISNVLESKTWTLCKNGYTEMSRALVKNLFDKSELVTSSLGGKSGQPLDAKKIAIIKDTIRTEFQVPASLMPSVWKECKMSITQMIKHIKKIQKCSASKKIG